MTTDEFREALLALPLPRGLKPGYARSVMRRHNEREAEARAVEAMLDYLWYELCDDCDAFVDTYKVRAVYLAARKGA